MKKYFLILTVSLVVIFCAHNLMAESTSFVYNDNGKRDPFWPLVSPGGAVLVYGEDVEFADMTLEGIIFDPKGERLAIVNGKVVKPSDSVGGFVVFSVQEDSVVLQKDGQEFILQLKKE